MYFEKLTRYLDSLEERYGVHGLTCIVMKNHAVLYRHMHGYSDYKRSNPVSGNELFDLYSCTKVITMIACMQLVERGKIRLDDEISTYIPEFKEAHVAEGVELTGRALHKMPDESWPSHVLETPIKLWHLMSMTAGLTYDTNGKPINELKQRSKHPAGTIEFAKAIAKLPLIFEPGTRFNYSLAHDVMAAVVEIVSKEKFSDYIKRHIFEPLGLKDCYFHIPKKEKRRLFAQYSIDRTTHKMTEQRGNMFRFTNKYDSGGAGLATTAVSYIAVLDALACGGVGWNGTRILNEESVVTMRTPILTDLQIDDFSQNGKFRPGYSYALGVRVLVDSNQSKSPVSEFGWDGAAGAYAMVDPVNHISVFYGQQVLGMIEAYTTVHPTVRDLVYESISEYKK